MDGLKRLSLLLLFLPMLSYADEVNHLLAELNNITDENQKVLLLSNELAGRPYHIAKGMHQPMYRFDSFDCQTFVQTLLALLHSSSARQFEINYFKAAYGAENANTLSFYNRNHFVETDLNRVNRRNGWLKDITSQGTLATFVQSVSAVIDKQQWFSRQGFHAVFRKQLVTMSYLPKQLIALTQVNGGYLPNTDLLKSIPTPAIAEIVNDPHRWLYHGKRIRAAIGTDLIVSHLGILYRQRFRSGELIYNRIICDLNWRHEKYCRVYPVKCIHAQCNELMFTHATSEYPRGFYWYKEQGQYVCTAQRPPRGISYTNCNRVEQIPLYAYLTNYHYGNYWIMNNPGLLGIHIERLF